MAGAPPCTLAENSGFVCVFLLGLCSWVFFPLQRWGRNFCAGKFQGSGLAGLHTLLQGDWTSLFGPLSFSPSRPPPPAHRISRIVKKSLLQGARWRAGRLSQLRAAGRRVGAHVTEAHLRAGLASHPPQPQCPPGQPRRCRRLGLRRKPESLLGASAQKRHSRTCHVKPAASSPSLWEVTRGSRLPGSECGECCQWSSYASTHPGGSGEPKKSRNPPTI